MRPILIVLGLAIIVSAGVAWYNKSTHVGDGLTVTVQGPDVVRSSADEGVLDRTKNENGEAHAERQEVPSTAVPRFASQLQTFLPEEIATTDYLSYDKETLRAIADSGDLSGLYVASTRLDWFSLEEREKYVLAAARQGELSGLLRMFFAYLPNGDNEGNTVTAYGYLIAAKNLGLPQLDDLALGDLLAGLSDQELKASNQFADKLVSDLGT